MFLVGQKKIHTSYVVVLHIKVGSLKLHHGVWGSAVNSTCGVWGRAPAGIKFVAL